MTSRILLLLSLALFGAGAWLAFAPVAAVPPVLVEEPLRDLGEQPLGVREVAFRITNPARTPRRVIGLAEG